MLLWWSCQRRLLHLRMLMDMRIPARTYMRHHFRLRLWARTRIRLRIAALARLTCSEHITLTPDTMCAGHTTTGVAGVAATATTTIGVVVVGSATVAAADDADDDGATMMAIAASAAAVVTVIAVSAAPTTASGYGGVRCHGAAHRGGAQLCAMHHPPLAR